jgi:trehalose 6-phosphate synthase/phosphatase
VTAVRPPALAREVARAARRPGAARALLLDIDGTLTPIAASRVPAPISRSVLAALEALALDGWRVAIVSGRSVAEARRMIPPPVIAIYGSHGIEREGRRLPRRLRPVAARLTRVARRARTLLAAWPGIEIEKKPIGLAFHDRILTAGARTRWRRSLAAWLAVQDLRGLSVMTGKCVTELTPAAAGKGIVAARWQIVRGTDPSLVVIGDDRSDEDLFAAFAGRALTVRVGPPGVRSEASRRLPSPRAVGRFLTELVDRTRAEAGR